MLPRPSANMEELNRILEHRFERFPKCKDNYEKYLKVAGNGFTKTDVDYYPIKMDYEVSSLCNFRCTMCLMSEIGGSGRPPHMTFEQYKNSIDHQPGLIEVKLQGMGEPLLNPDFFDIAAYTVENDIWARTVTNASLLHQNKNYKKIIDVGIGEIQISIDGATKETFESIRRGSNFDQVVENCKKMNHYAREKGEGWRTSCWMLVQQSNFHEIEELIDLAEYMEFSRLTYSISISDWGKDNWKKINDAKEVTEVFTDELGEKLVELGKGKGIEVTFWDGKDKYMFDEKRDKICAWLFSRAFISSDMRIVPCCVVSDPKTCELGDANSFEKEWNNELYKKMRELHIDGKNLPYICKNCYY